MKRATVAAALLVVAAIVLSALSLKTHGAETASANPARGMVLARPLSSTACARWSIVPSPNGPGPSINSLWGVTAISASDAWAVGHTSMQRDSGQTLIEHWDGTQWSVTPSPNPGSNDNFVYNVAAVSPSDIWAVGYYANADEITRTLTEHWNGTQWSVVPSPSPGAENNQLFSVSAVSANDIWAVGFLSEKATKNQKLLDQTLIEHWDGARWKVVTSPNPFSTVDHLEGVAAISANDVWAVGTGGTAGQTLIEHWDGSHWSLVTSPSPGTGGDLRQVAAVSANDVWAAGYYIDTTGQTLAEHWNGTSWSVVPSSNVGTSPNFSGVAALSATDVWAVGSGFNSDFAFQTLTERWDGTQWQVVTSPNPVGATNVQLLAVATSAPADVWAVGHSDGNTLIEHFACH